MGRPDSGEPIRHPNDTVRPDAGCPASGAWDSIWRTGHKDQDVGQKPGSGYRRLIPITPPSRPVHLAPPGGRIAGAVGYEGGRSAAGRPVAGRVRATWVRRVRGMLEEGGPSQARCPSRVDSPRGGWGDRAGTVPLSEWARS